MASSFRSEFDILTPTIAEKMPEAGEAESPELSKLFIPRIIPV
jgi:hypothetical protein